MHCRREQNPWNLVSESSPGLLLRQPITWLPTKTLETPVLSILARNVHELRCTKEDYT